MRIHRHTGLWSFLSLLLLLGLVLSACGGNSTGNTGTPPGKALTKVSIGLGYIPDIQFAPFYVAKSKGYYQAAGLDVTFHHGIVNDLIGSMIGGANTFVFVSGDEELVARSKHLSVVNVSTVFQRYPVSLIVPANSPIHTLADLKGHTIGVPGPFGATYVGLLALLYHAHLSVADIHMQSIGFTQVAALLGKRVDAVMGYANNEPLQLQQRGFSVRTFAVADYQPLISNGVVTMAEALQSQPQVVRSFVQATMKGLKDTIADPTGAVQISKAFIPGLTDTAHAMSILQATIPLWQSQKLGYNDSATWQSMANFMVAQKLIPAAPDLAQAYTNQFVS
jgi:putative riboflavin transport system substrate-binding protein